MHPAAQTLHTCNGFRHTHGTDHLVISNMLVAAVSGQLHTVLAAAAAGTCCVHGKLVRGPTGA
jgi:hypothetical protein